MTDTKIAQLLLRADQGDLSAMTEAAFLLAKKGTEYEAYMAAKASSVNSETAAPPLPSVFSLYEKAARQGFIIAQYNLGCLYMSSQNDFPKQDYVQACHWLKLAAEAGDSDAQFTLAYIYQRGLLGEADHEAARLWYEKAAHNGSGRAQYDLACIYLNRDNVAYDRQKAIYWFEQAAQSGVNRARAHLLELQ